MGTGSVLLLLKAQIMSDYEDKLVQADLNLTIYCTNELEVDRNGNSFIVNVIYLGEDDDPVEVRVDMSDVIEEMIEDYGDTDGYQHLYMVAHELSRHAETLREKASYIEDSTNAVGRLFDVD